jgi:bifunctional enzyme CysN/CysC
MHAEPLALDRTYVLMHTSRQVQARITAIDYRVDVDTLHREPAATLELNDIGRVAIATGQPLFFDSYRLNSATGSFILIDPQTNVTVAAGMIRGELRQVVKPRSGSGVSTDVVWQGWTVPREEREARNGHRAGVIWLTGLSGAGKSTIARELERRLFDDGRRTMLLDGDNLRHGLCGDLGFSPEDRAENIRRAGEVARLFFEQGCLVLCAFVSPYRKDRDRARSLVPAGRFLEVFVTAPPATLRARDPKGLYTRAGSGRLPQFTGMSAPYEAPVAPELMLHTDRIDAHAAAAQVLEAIRSLGWLQI